MLKSKYCNKRSISYLSWKANNDQLRKLNAQLKKKSGVLSHFTKYVNDVASAFLKSERGSTTPRYRIYKPIAVKLVNYSKAESEYLENILAKVKEAFNTLATPQITDISQLTTFDLRTKLISAPVDDKIVETNSFSLNLPPCPVDIKSYTRDQHRQYLVILKDILQAEKNALDKQLTGSRSSVFISTALDLRDRIRIFLRSLHIPTHDGKDEESVRIVNNNRSNYFFLTYKYSVYGQEVIY